MKVPAVIDLHMHSVVSDGTDTPQELISRVKDAGITLFSLTDHDAFNGCETVRRTLGADDPAFIDGIEVSCRDAEGQYHILGYGFDRDAAAMKTLVETGHGYRMKKLAVRLAYLKETYGFDFSDEDRASLAALNNPGKPHIAKLMIRYGYAPTVSEAIRTYLNGVHVPDAYIRPEQAIEAISASHGIPVLAHPSLGRGDENIVGDDMEKRLKKLIGFGLSGVEAFYSGFTPFLQAEILAFADRFGLYVTAGSDYHGENKKVRLGDTHLLPENGYPDGLCRFLERVSQTPMR